VHRFLEFFTATNRARPSFKSCHCPSFIRIPPPLSISHSPTQPHSQTFLHTPTHQAISSPWTRRNLNAGSPTLPLRFVQRTQHSHSSLGPSAWFRYMLLLVLTTPPSPFTVLLFVGAGNDG
jgi:hypothetical protein